MTPLTPMSPVPGATTGARCENCLTLLPPHKINGKPAPCVLCDWQPPGDAA